MFVVTLEVLSAFDRYFPRLEAERMANIIRDGVRAKSCSFIGLVPFKVTVAQIGETDSASGETRKYIPEECDEVSEESAASLPIDTKSSDELRECDSDS
jgi:hypothetical protein